MKYTNTIKAEFLDRPNRFIAHVKIEDQVETVHVKNTGRCKELLVPGAEVVLEFSGNPARKTKYDLICVNKKGRWINMDSQIPNKAAAHWVRESGYFPEDVAVYTEKKFGNSRFDLYVESYKRKAFIEVKGVTLEENNIARFPDAPTQRGVKHVEELIRCKKEGYEAYLLFVIQMKNVKLFQPNWQTHPRFGEALCHAAAEGVKLLAYDCEVTENTIEIKDAVPIDLNVPDRSDWSSIFLQAKSTAACRRTGEGGRRAMLNDEIVQPLLMWYGANKRELPWRDKNNAYYTWVSEIMLQQTRVEAVKPYFARFTEELPDIAALAACPEEKLMKLWEGLGYYNRVRNMQKAAVTIVEEFDGVMPASYEAILSLKGIGNYTAGAIASIAWGIPVPAVDGNVLRVISRITESREDIMKQSVRRNVEAAIRGIIPDDRPGDFNQALMELGAVVCVPNGPAKCEECPVARFCRARLHNTVEELPVRAPRKARTIEKITVLVIQDGERTAISKRPDSGLLAGLYQFPNVPGHLTVDEALKLVTEMALEPLHIEALPPAKHIFSHIEWRMIGYHIRVSSLAEPENPELIFVEKQQSKRQYAIPSAFRAYVKYMKEEKKK